MNWISVKDRLPEVGEHDLLLCETYRGETGYYIGGLDEMYNKALAWDIGEFLFYDDDFLRITHWAKIASPPEVTE